MTALTGQIWRQERLCDAVRAEMFALHRRYYCGVERSRFLADMAEKDWVSLLTDAAGRVGGYSTARLLRLTVEGREDFFLFSGDTVVDRLYWNTLVLPACFCHLMMRLLHEHAGHALYWFLITKGYRTYRYLPVYFKNFYPRHAVPTPPALQRRLDAVARHKFGAQYDATTGLISAPGAKERLTPELTVAPEHRQRDPHIAYFLQRNPEHLHGVELACLTQLAPENFRPAIPRLLARTAVTWVEA